MNNKNSKMLGIILVPLVFGILILVASAFAKVPEKAEDSFYEENSKNVMGGNKNYEDRGYVKANDFPQALQNLVASGILTAQEVTDEDGYEDETSRYRSSYECLLDSRAFMVQRTGAVVSVLESETDYVFKLKYDSKNKGFTEDSYATIAKVEQCGFTGFTDQVKRLEKEYQSRQAKKTEEEEDWDLTYAIYNQGVEFQFIDYDQNEIEVNLKLNINSIYLPQKYETLIRNVTQSGEYMLRASSVDNKKEVLTFGAANVVMTEGTGEVFFSDGQSMPTFGDTTISFVFENNQVTGYYVTTNENKFQLTESDKKLIQTVAQGLKVSLPEHANYSENGNKLYIAK